MDTNKVCTNSNSKYEVTIEDVKLLTEALTDQERRSSDTQKKKRRNPIFIVLSLILFIVLTHEFKFENSVLYFSIGLVASLILFISRDIKLYKQCRLELIMLNYVSHIQKDAVNSYESDSYVSEGFPSNEVLGEGLS